MAGSDEEVDHYDAFNYKTNLPKRINLKLLLKFEDVGTLRKALRKHFVENNYV